MVPISNRLFGGQTYEKIVETYSDTVIRICAIRCGNIEDANDCYQNVFLKLYLSQVDFVSDTHIRAWLIKVAITTSADCTRQYWRNHVLLHGNDKDTLNLIDSLSHQSLESPTEKEALIADSYVVKAVFRLPLKYRQVIYLHYFEELEVAEIANLLGLTQGTVKSQLSRGRSLLKKVLAPQYYPSRMEKREVNYNEKRV